MNEDFLYAVDWTAIGVITLVIFLPILLVFLYLCYRHYLQHQRRQLNDELILKLAQEGQTLTPELVDTIRKEENKNNKESGEENIRSEAYQKMCTGAALILGGLIVLIRNRVFALIMIIFGIFIISQGVALYLTDKNNGQNANKTSNN